MSADPLDDAPELVPFVTGEELLRRRFEEVAAHLLESLAGALVAVDEPPPALEAIEPTIRERAKELWLEAQRSRPLA